MYRLILILNKYRSEDKILPKLRNIHDIADFNLVLLDLFDKIVLVTRNEFLYQHLANDFRVIILPSGPNCALVLWQNSIQTKQSE